jgi:hypothetical protein
MTPTEVNALLTKPEPLTDDEKKSLSVLPYLELLLGNGVELTPFGEPNREFLTDLFSSHGTRSYRLSL